jgi:glutaredoxin 3
MPEFRHKLEELTGRWTVPQILIDDRPIGGFTELVVLDRAGELDEIAA